MLGICVRRSHYAKALPVSSPNLDCDSILRRIRRRSRPELQPSSTRTVSGTRIGHFKNGPVPVDLSTTTIAALVPNGSGGYNVLAGTGTSSGTFSIPNVPTGLYLLQIGTDYVWTSNTVLDADYFADYRSDIVRANSSTTTTFDLANLHSWQGTDFLELVCPNNLTFEGPFPATLGATTFTGNFPYFGNLSVAAEGDQYDIAQLITENLGGYFFTGLGKYFAPTKFDQAQGSDTSFNGKFKTVARSLKFVANINGADLAAQALAANPGAVLVNTSVGLSVYPGSFAHGQTTDTADLVIQQTTPFLVTNATLARSLTETRIPHIGRRSPAMSGWPAPVIWPREPPTARLC